MSYKHMCGGCLAEKGAASECPACGWCEGKLPESPLHLPPHTLLNGRYLIGRVLGQGGFGITYLARDMSLINRFVAVKEYLPRDIATRASNQLTVCTYSGELTNYFKDGMEKFYKEANALTQFDEHPGIVSVRDYFKENGTAYMVMQYLEGLTFKQYLAQKGGKIPYEAALSILMPVMDALREVHQVGILHRDISPDNIYITNSKQVKILDFGAARYAAGEHSKSLSVILKAGFAPEEQYRSRGNQGPWTDVYAVAATFYRAITGQSLPEALDRLEEDSLKPPSQLGVAISPAAEKAMLKALSVRASGRFQTIKDFQDALMGAYPLDQPESQIITKCPSCGTVNKVPSSVPFENAKCVKCHNYIKKRDEKNIPTHSVVKKSFAWLFVAAGVIVVLFVSGAIYNKVSASKGDIPTVSVPGTTSSPVSLSNTKISPQEELAQKAVKEHYNYISAQNYRAAYNCFSTKLQNEFSFESWKEGFRKTLQDDVYNLKVLKLNDSTATVSFEMTSCDRADGNRRLYQEWSGTWNLIKENGRWVLDDPYITKKGSYYK